MVKKWLVSVAILASTAFSMANANSQQQSWSIWLVKPGPDLKIATVKWAGNNLVVLTRYKFHSSAGTAYSTRPLKGWFVDFEIKGVPVGFYVVANQPPIAKPGDSIRITNN